nr:hypothetical protein [Leuven Partiti-like virus 1]
MKYLGYAPGFGMRPGSDTLSPYAVAAFGPQPHLRPRSQLSYRLVEKDLMEMGSNQNTLNFQDPLIKEAQFHTAQAFRFDTRVKPIHLNDIFDMEFEFRHSSPGIPWQPDYATRGDVMDDFTARNSIRWFWHRIKKGEKVSLPDTKVLYRAHIAESSGKPKIRAVYGFPTTITLAEAQFAVPLIAGFKKYDTPLSYQFDMVTGGANKLRGQIAKFKRYLCLDFKGFDKSVSADMIRMAFDVLEQNINWTEYQNHGVPDASRLYRVWQSLINYFINTNVRLCDGRRFLKNAGIPSGSFFTQLIDSIVNHFLLTYAFLVLKNRRPHYIRVFGDDSVIADSDFVHICDIARVMYDLGMMINLSKSIQTEDIDKVEYLGFCIRGGFPHRGYNKWLESLYHPERADLEWDDFASRALGLFYANHGVHERFDEMCRQVIGYRPFHIRMSRDFKRFLAGLGISHSTMSTDLPDRMRLLFSLIG